MELEEGMLRKIAVSVVAVGLFVVLILAIGATQSNGGLGSTGGLALIASIVLFVLAMAAVGLGLSRT